MDNQCTHLITRTIAGDGNAVAIALSEEPGIGLHLVGVPDDRVKEILLRVCTALQSIGVKIPSRKLIIDVVPTGQTLIHEDYAFLDLPIAVAIAMASKGKKFQSEPPFECPYILCGELSLDAKLRPVKRALTRVNSNHMSRDIILPRANREEMKSVNPKNVVFCGNLMDVLKKLGCM